MLDKITGENNTKISESPAKELAGDLLEEAPVIGHIPKAIKYARKTLTLFSPAYGYVDLSLFMVMDFKDIIRLDDWTVTSGKILKSMNAKKEDNTFTIGRDLKNVEIIHEIFFLPKEIDCITEHLLEKSEYEMDERELFVKRAKIYAIPYEVGEEFFLRAIVTLANYEEKFVNDLDLRKTFIGVNIKFNNEDIRKKFSIHLSKMIEKEGFNRDEYTITEQKMKVKIIFPKLVGINKFFEIIGKELFKMKIRYYFDTISH